MLIRRLKRANAKLAILIKPPGKQILAAKGQKKIGTTGKIADSKLILHVDVIFGLL